MRLPKEEALAGLQDACNSMPIQRLRESGLFYELDALLDLTPSQTNGIRVVLQEVEDEAFGPYGYGVNTLSKEEVQLIGEAAERWLYILRFRYERKPING